MTATNMAGVVPPPGPERPGAAPEAVSLDQARRLFGIGRTKLYELIRDGVLPTVKIGKRRLVRLETMRRVLASLEHTGIDRAS